MPRAGRLSFTDDDAELVRKVQRRLGAVPRPVLCHLGLLPPREGDLREPRNRMERELRRLTLGLNLPTRPYSGPPYPSRLSERLLLTALGLRPYTESNIVIYAPDEQAAWSLHRQLHRPQRVQA